MAKTTDGDIAPQTTEAPVATALPGPKPGRDKTEVVQSFLPPAATQAKSKALARDIIARQSRFPGHSPAVNGTKPRPSPADCQAWLTPKEPVLTPVMAALGISAFTIDAASNGPGTSNVTALTHFTKGDAEGGGLQRCWCGSVVWCNPPYKRITPWVVKARETVQGGDADLVIGLLPANVGAKWYHENIVGHAHVLFLRGRLHFDAKPGQPGGPAKDSSMLVIWGGRADQIRRLAAAFPDAEHKPLPGWVAACALPPVEPPVAAPVVEADPATACIELFAGGGSVHLAMREAGYTTVFANDFCPGKRASYAGNFPTVPLDGRDVRNLRGHDLPHAAFLTASSPCTDHSVNGRQAGFAGEHGPLAFEVIRLVGEMRATGRAPRVVAFENVLGLLTFDKGREFASLVQALASEGYLVGAVVMDAARFVPQSRGRVFLVGVRNDLEVPACLVASRPTRAWHSAPLRRAHAQLSMAGRQAWRWLTLPRPPRRKVALANVLEADRPGMRWDSPEATARIAAGFAPADVARIAAARASGVTVGIVRIRPRKGADGWTRDYEARFDGRARCLTTSDRGDRQALAFLDDSPLGLRIRGFTSRERARLTGLPDDYALPGVMRSRELTGDAIVVPVYAWLARHLLRLLADAPLAAVPQVASPVRARKERDADGQVLSDRRGIKGATVSQSDYLMPSAHARLAASAAEEGISVTEFKLRLADRYYAARGEPPLERYVPPPRKRGHGGKRAARGSGIPVSWSLLMIGRMPERASSPRVAGLGLGFAAACRPAAVLARPSRDASAPCGGAARPVRSAGVPRFLSPLRYVGGKGWLAVDVARWAAGSRVLVEPFAGGAGVALRCVLAGAVERAVLVERHDIASVRRSSRGILDFGSSETCSATTGTLSWCSPDRDQPRRAANPQMLASARPSPST